MKTYTGNAEVHYTSIFSMCLVMYGGFACLWLVYYSSASKLTEARRNYLYIALICATWCSTSVGMHTLNKSVATLLQAPALCSMAQMAVAVVLVGSVSFGELLRAPRTQLGKWMVVPFFFASMLGSSFYTFEYISLSLLTIVRNLTPLVVLPIERLVMPVEKQPQINSMVVIAILVMLCGAVTYGHGVKDVSLVGIAFAVVNMFLAVADRVLQRRLLTQECKDLKPSVCTLMNNIWGMVPTFFLAHITGQVAEAHRPERAVHWRDPNALALLALSGVVGIGICYLGFECQRAISATSFFVLQNVAKVVVVGCGILFFDDPVTPLTACGLLLSITGSFFYGRAQLQGANGIGKSKLEDEESVLPPKSKEAQ